MGRSNAAIRTYIGKAERFADLFNYYLFDGLAVIKAEDLETADGESDVIVENKDGKEQEVHRYRDITMRWKYGAKLTILACENQEKVHYAMPVRTMIYDGLSYVEQIKRMGSALKEKKITQEEFLSKFGKDDKLIPVITLVFYYGLEEWDASKDLYGMLDVNEKLKESNVFQKFISNYKINLIDAGNMKQLENLQTDLQVVLGMVQCRSNTKSMKDYVKEHEEYFRNVDKDAFNAMMELLQSKAKLKKAMETVDTESGKEKVNMCKAIDGIYEEGYNKGKEEMREYVTEAEGRVQKAEEEKQKAEEKVQKTLEDVAIRMLKTMDDVQVAELLGLKLVDVKQLKLQMTD